MLNVVHIDARDPESVKSMPAGALEALLMSWVPLCEDKECVSCTIKRIFLLEILRRLEGFKG